MKHGNRRHYGFAPMLPPGVSLGIHPINVAFDTPIMHKYNAIHGTRRWLLSVTCCRQRRNEPQPRENFVNLGHVIFET